jgi:hypothetical protein
MDVEIQKNDKGLFTINHTLYLGLGELLAQWNSERIC